MGATTLHIQGGPVEVMGAGDFFIGAGMSSVESAGNASSFVMRPIPVAGKIWNVRVRLVANSYTTPCVVSLEGYGPLVTIPPGAVGWFDSANPSTKLSIPVGLLGPFKFLAEGTTGVISVACITFNWASDTTETYTLLGAKQSSTSYMAAGAYMSVHGGRSVTGDELYIDSISPGDFVWGGYSFDREQTDRTGPITFTSQVNGVTGNQSFTYPATGGASKPSDPINTDVLTLGDKFCFRGDGNLEDTGRLGMEGYHSWLRTTDDTSLVMIGGNYLAQNDGSVRYSRVGGQNASFVTAEEAQVRLGFKARLDNLSLAVGRVSGSAAMDLYLIVNGERTPLHVYQAGVGTVVDSTHSVVVQPDDEICLERSSPLGGVRIYLSSAAMRVTPLARGKQRPAATGGADEIIVAGRFSNQMCSPNEPRMLGTPNVELVCCVTEPGQNTLRIDVLDAAGVVIDSYEESANGSGQKLCIEVERADSESVVAYLNDEVVGGS